MNELQEIFEQMIEAYRGRLTLKPNRRAEKFIKEKRKQFDRALHREDERVALHLQSGNKRDDAGRIIGWKTCDCRACTIVGRSPAGPDFRYSEV